MPRKRAVNEAIEIPRQVVWAAFDLPIPSSGCQAFCADWVVSTLSAESERILVGI